MNYAQLLRRRLFLVQALVLAAFCLVVVAGISFPLYLHLADDIEREFAAGVVSRAEAVSQWVIRAEDVARQITSRSRIRQELEKFNAGEITLDELTNFTRPKLDDAIRTSLEVLGVTRLDAKGRAFVELGILPPANATRDILPLPNEVFLGHLFKSGGEPYLWLRAPILNRKGNVVGVDVVVVSTQGLSNVIKNKAASHNQAHLGLGCFLISHKDNQIIAQDCLESIRDRKELASALLQKAKTTKTKIISTSFSIQDLLCVLAPVPTSDWTMIACMDRSHVAIPIIDDMLYLAPLVMFLYLLCLAGFSVASRPLSHRLLMAHSELETEVANKTRALQRELQARTQAENEKDKLIEKLETALSSVKQLRGLLPICASCKKIRDDNGYWNRVESYIQQHSDAQFSHGICPECAKKLYPEIFDKPNND